MSPLAAEALAMELQKIISSVRSQPPNHLQSCIQNQTAIGEPVPHLFQSGDTRL